MKRLLVLSPVPMAGASTRYRLAQYFPALRAAGVEAELRPFFDDDELDVFYRPGHPLAKLRAALHAFAGRVGDVVRARGYDGVLLHREAALIGPPVFEWCLARGLRLPMIFDLDDAIWVPYASPTYGALLSRLFKAPGKTYFSLRAARSVVCGNQYCADFARRFNDDVVVIPTVVDSDVFVPAPAARETPVIGWVGSHSTLQYLRTLTPVFQALARERRFRLVVVGAELDAPGVDVDNRPWARARELADFQGLDIGVYPIVEDAWALGKSGFKAVQYMAVGVPVLASPVGVTVDMVRDGVNGYLCATPEAWLQRLRQLLDAPAERQRLGAAGRAEAVARWSLAAHAPRFVDVVTRALGLTRPSHPDPAARLETACTFSD